jgi:hypothetical protein
MVRSLSRSLPAGLIVIGLAGWSSAALAQAAAPALTPEGAAALADQVDKGVRLWFPPTGEGAAFQWDGRTAAVVAGDHYNVELPALQVTNDDGSRLGVGKITLALKPEADGVWGVGLAVPSPIAMLAADGKPEGELTIGRQSFTGRWLSRLETLVKADGTFGDIKAVSKKDKSLLQIGAILVRTDLAEAAPGRWSGPSALSLQNFAMNDEHGIQVARLGSVAIEADVVGMDLNHAATLNQKAEAIPAAEGALALRKRLALLNGLFSSAQGRVVLSDLALTAPADGSNVRLERIGIRLGVEGFDQEKSTLSVGYDHAGLKLEPPPGPTDFLPVKVELALAAASLPNNGLWATFTKALDAPAGKDDTIGQALAGQLLGALTQAGSKLRIDALNLDSAALAARVKGEARFNAQSPMGVVADINMSLRGLEAAAKQLQPKPGAKVDEEAQNILAMVTMAQAFGAPAKDEAGRDIRTYALQLDAGGRMMLNGADMSALFPTAPAPAPAANGKKVAPPATTGKKGVAVPSGQKDED